MFLDPTAGTIEIVALAGAAAGFSYCGFELIRLLGPKPPRRPAASAPGPTSFRGRDVGALVPLCVGTITLGSGILSSRLWSAGAWVPVAIGLGIGWLALALLITVASSARMALALRLPRLRDQMDAAGAYRATAWGASVAAIGAVASVLLAVLLGFLLLGGLAVALGAAAAILWTAVTVRTEASRRKLGPVIWAGAALLTATITPQLVAAADPLALELVPSAPLFGLSLACVALASTACAAVVSRRKVNPADDRHATNAFLVAAVVEFAGAAVVLGWLTGYPYPYLVLCGLGVGAAVLVYQPLAGRSPVLGLSVAAATAAAAAWLGGWIEWPYVQVWNGGLAILGVTLAVAVAASLAPAAALAAQSGLDVASELSAWPPDPRGTAGPEWADTVLRTIARARDGERGFQTATAGLIGLSILACLFPIVARLLGTDTLSILVVLRPIPVAVGAALGGLSAIFTLAALRPRTQDGAAGGGLPAPLSLVALLLSIAGALLVVRWVGSSALLGYLPGLFAGSLLGGAAIRVRRRSAPEPGAARVIEPTSTILLLSSIALLLATSALAALQLAPLVHWSPGR